MRDLLDSGAWYNKSRTVLLAVAAATALTVFLFCAGTAYFVAQYFVCIDGCSSATPPFLLIAVSAFLGLIPAVGTGAIGYFIVKDLWEDAKDAKDAKAATTSKAHSHVSRPEPVARPE